VRHTLRSSGLFRVEASRVRISQSSMKTNGGVTADGTRGTIADVTSSPS
jgi:hypothetical protein